MATAELGINITARNRTRGVLRSLQGDLKGLRGSLGDIGKFAAGNVIASGITASIGAITTAAKGAVGLFVDASMAAADFNAQISSIGAISGATAAELGQLKQLASDLGVDPKLKVSSMEAAQAIEMLARNGLKVPEILNGAAKSTVLLANATGADFANAADISTDVMALFNIEAENMIDAVDGITSVTTNSKFSIDDYRLALAQGGGVAASSGVEFEDFNATIAAIAPLFASGSDAGTAFKTFIQRMVPQSNAAADAMQELGLVTISSEKALQTLNAAGIEIASTGMDDIFAGLAEAWMEMNDTDVVDDKKFQKWLRSSELMQNAFFDANGEMKEMAEIFGIMERATSGLSEEQRILTLTTIFGTDAVRAATGMAKVGEEAYRDLLETMGDTSAVEIAAEKQNNLAGDMAIFASTIESVRTKIGDEFDLSLRAVFQSANTLFNDLQPQIISFASGVASALDGVVARVVDAKAKFDFLASGGNIGGGLLAALGTATGAQVTVPIGAEIVSVDWGETLGATYDAEARILTVDWTNSLLGETTFTYDVDANVLNVDWSSFLGTDSVGGFTYDAEAGITAVNWNEPGFHYIYNADAEIISVLWGGYSSTYMADAYVVDVGWGAYTHTYNVAGSATSVLWGAYTTTYDVGAQVSETSILWGTFTYVYDAAANVSSYEVNLEGNVVFDAMARVTSAVYELQTVFSLPATASVSSVAVSVKDASVDMVGNIVSFTNSVAEKSIDVIAKVASWAGVEFEWPDYPEWSWVEYNDWTWPDYADWSWPDYAIFSWPQFPSFSWPSIPKPTWRWPSIPKPGWVGTIESIFSKGIPVREPSQRDRDSGAFDEDGTFNYGNALGTRNYRGGVTWVGETGPELVSLPRGSRIYSNNESMALAGAGGDINVTVNVANVASGIDIESMAYQVAQVIKRRR